MKENTELLFAGAGKAQIIFPDTVFPTPGECYTGVYEHPGVKVLILKCKDEGFVLADFELVSLNDDVAYFQKDISKMTGIREESVWICVTHSLPTPHIPRDFKNCSASDAEKYRLMHQSVKKALECAVRDALESLQEAKFGFGTGRCSINVNRVISSVDGWWLGNNESGVTDSTVPVFRFDNKEGKPIAVLFNYNAQCSVMDASYTLEGGRLICPDLAGTSAAFVEEQFDGCVAMYCLGAGGDQAPGMKACYTVREAGGHLRTTDLHETGYLLVKILGERLGQEVVCTAENIVCSELTGPLKTEKKKFTYGAKAIPNMKDIVPCKEYDYHPLGEVTTEVNVLQLGEAVLAGVQPEIGVRTEMALKQGSPFAITGVMTFVNGGAKYMPESDLYDMITFQSMNSRFEKGTAEKFLGDILDLLGSMKKAGSARMIKTRAISRIYGEGEKITGILMEYNDLLSGEGIGPGTFSVEGRTVTGAFVTDDSIPFVTGKMDVAEAVNVQAAHGPVKSGHFVILSLDTEDENALTVYELPREDGRPGGTSDIRKTEIRITQRKPIFTVSGDCLYIQDPVLCMEKIQPAVERFGTYTYYLKDTSENRRLDYNLFIPEEYDPEKEYPLLLFVEDAGRLSDNVAVTLCQGLGAVVWTEPDWQETHPAFVLAPQYPGPDSIVEDDFSCTWGVEATMELLQHIVNEYSIDGNRIYGTGQSMGCMTLCELNVRYPSVFAGCLLVGGQWNPEIMPKARENNLWISVSEGDEKAFPGMNAVTQRIEQAGTPVGKMSLDAEACIEELNTQVEQLGRDGNHIHYTWFTGDSVIPKGVTPTPLLHHKNTWRVTYQIKALREWLFAQRKNSWEK